MIICHEGKNLSSNECGIFEPIIQTPKGVNPVSYKWVFVRKMNAKNVITRYKAQFVAQDFLKKHWINYEHYIPPIMDPIYKF